MNWYQNSEFDVITFDFDGVLVDSNSAKEIALAKVVSELFDFEFNYVYFYIRDNPGKSRKHYFDYFESRSSIKSIDSTLIDNAFKSFSQDVKHIYSSSRIQESLEKFRQVHPNSDWFILSSANANEIKEFLSERLLLRYFKGVFGGPNSKFTNYNNYILPFVSDPNKCLHIGDGSQDIMHVKSSGVKGALLTSWSAEPNLLLDESNNPSFIVVHCLADLC